MGSFERNVLWRISRSVQVDGVGRIQYSKELYRLHKDTDLITYMHFKRLQWAGVVVLKKRVPQRILKRSFGGRRPAVKPRGRWEDEVQETAAKLLNRENRRAVARHNSDWRTKNR